MKDNTTYKKLANLKANIEKYDKVMVAFSGGVDSTFLLAVCAETLGKHNVEAATAFSSIHSESELSYAKSIALKTGIHHTAIESHELSDTVFSSNPKDRCYYCKKNMFSKLLAISKKMNIRLVLDGSNADDVSDYRPGYKALSELEIISPLMDAGLTKEEIRFLSKEMNLQTWDKPANPCLASRIPYGNIITKEKLATVDKAETFIRSMGFDTIRVRHHDSIARIELSPEDISRFMIHGIREQVVRHLKKLGFTWIAVDIEGYRMGSLNSAIDQS